MLMKNGDFEINQEQDITILCSLHFLDLVQRYASKVVGLRDGKLVFEGTNEDIGRITDERFKQIYGEEAQRLNVG